LEEDLEVHLHKQANQREVSYSSAPNYFRIDVIFPNVRVKFSPTHPIPIYTVSLDICYWIANDAHIPNDNRIYSEEVLNASRH
jgi:hypothetical protein